jgi:hypothetical protein
MTIIAEVLNTNMSTKLKRQSCLQLEWSTVRVNTCQNSVSPVSISVSHCFCTLYPNKSAIHYSRFYLTQYCLFGAFVLGAIQWFEICVFSTFPDNYYYYYYYLLSPVFMVFTIICLKQPMFLGYMVLQLLFTYGRPHVVSHVESFILILIIIIIISVIITIIYCC